MSADTGNAWLHGKVSQFVAHRFENDFEGTLGLVAIDGTDRLKMIAEIIAEITLRSPETKCVVAADHGSTMTTIRKKIGDRLGPIPPVISKPLWKPRPTKPHGVMLLSKAEATIGAIREAEFTVVIALVPTTARAMAHDAAIRLLSSLAPEALFLCIFGTQDAPGHFTDTFHYVVNVQDL